MRPIPAISARSIGVVVTVLLLACVVYLEFRPDQKPLAPADLMLSNCGVLKPGVRRIGDYGFQFDVPVNDFTVHEGWGDVPATPHGYGLRPKNSTSELGISWYSQAMSFGGVPEVPALSSGYLEKRRIFDRKGNVIGEDSWGDWDNGQHWRRVHLEGSISVSYGSRNKRELPSYGSVHQKDAALFDRVISSACSLSVASQ